MIVKIHVVTQCLMQHGAHVGPLMQLPLPIMPAIALIPDMLRYMLLLMCAMSSEFLSSRQGTCDNRLMMVHHGQLMPECQQIALVCPRQHHCLR